MGTRQRFSTASFVAGLATATVLTGVPAAAIVAAAVDPQPDVYDGRAPTLTRQPLRFVIGASLDRAALPPADGDCPADNPWNWGVPLEMRWRGADTTSGISTYDVWQSSPGYIGKDVEGTTATSHRIPGTNYTGDCGGGSATAGFFWVVAHDHRGNSSTSSAVTRHVNVWQETGTDVWGNQAIPITRSGTWRTASCTCFNNGRTLASARRKASLTYTITTRAPGQVVAVIAEKASNRGVMKIRLDGARPTRVNTYSPSPTHRVVVWQKAIASPGTHTLKITNAGTRGRSRIDVDGIALTTGAWTKPPEIDAFVTE